MKGLSVIRALIADDERLGREYLRALVEQDARFQVVSVCEDGVDAVDQSERSKVDVAFLDIRMPQLDGFKTFEAMGEDAPIVVFVTAYSDQAVRAYEFGAFDYVTKPIDPLRFARVLNRVSERMLERQAASLDPLPSGTQGPGGESNEHSLRVLSGIRKDLVYSESEIEVIESQGNYIDVRIRGELCRVRESLDNFWRKLESPLFVRTHRSFVVNMRCVQSIQHGRSGTAELTLADGYAVPVSRRHRNKVVEILRSMPTNN